MGGWMTGLIETDSCKDKWIDRQTDRWTDRRLDRQRDRHSHRQANGSSLAPFFRQSPMHMHLCSPDTQDQALGIQPHWLLRLLDELLGLQHGGSGDQLAMAISPCSTPWQMTI